MLSRLFPVLGLLILLTCGCAPVSQVSIQPGFTPPSELDAVYVVPFTSILVPPPVSDTLFDTFVDLLNEGRAATSVQQFIILKPDLAEVDPAWLAQQVYITGEVWGYVESSGCCSTEMRVKARASLFEPGKKTPAVEVTLPLESFFEHDRATPADVQQRLSSQAARQLSSQILKALRR